MRFKIKIRITQAYFVRLKAVIIKSRLQEAVANSSAGRSGANSIQPRFRSLLLPVNRIRNVLKTFTVLCILYNLKI